MFLVALVVFTSLTLLHLVASPYTKVEESFNIQAIHDILTYGIPSNSENATAQFHAQYDHMSFPGAVPRTFVGALALASLSKPFIWLGVKDRQFLVRAVLGCLNAASLAFFALRARRAFAKQTVLIYVLLQASQFHIFYYASRTLPNMFAFFLTTLALALLIPGDTGCPCGTGIRVGVFLLTLTSVVFRSEIALLLFCHVGYLVCWPTRFFSLNWTMLTHAILPAGLSGAILGLGLTIFIDTFFWQSPSYLWPELSAFLSNLFPSKGSLGASEWGTSPWHWYFSNALPRILLIPPIYLLFWTLGALKLPDSRNIQHVLIPNMSYIVLYSALAHKETRFIFPVIPALTLAACPALAYLWTHRHKSRIHSILVWLTAILTLFAFLLSHTILLPLSSLSYPGAHALNDLQKSISSTEFPHPTTLHVHLDNLSTQTGITLFLQAPSFSPDPNRPRLIFDKSPTDPASPAWSTEFDYLITESPPSLAPAVWDTISTIHSLGRPRLVRPGNEQVGGLDALMTQLLGQRAGRASLALREMGRVGTGGRWVDIDWMPRLVVLRRRKGAGKGGGGQE